MDFEGVDFVEQTTFGHIVVFSEPIFEDQNLDQQFVAAGFEVLVDTHLWLVSLMVRLDIVD